MSEVREAFEITISGNRRVLLVEGTSDHMELIYRYAAFTGEESPAAAMSVTAKIGAQLTIVEVAGEKVNFEQVRERWKELFPKMRDVEALKGAWMQINYPGGAEKVVPVPVTIG